MRINPIEIQESVDRYLHFFCKRIEDIRNLECGDSTALFSKILFYSLLDTLSKTTVPPDTGNKDRVVKFVRNFCDWPNSEKVSLPHLIRLLDTLTNLPNNPFLNLRKYAKSLYDQWVEGADISLNRDPTFQEIKNLWPQDIPDSSKIIPLKSLQHINLFYQYRCTLVHELRKPGYGIENFDEQNPSYHSMIDMESRRMTWELVYPLKFYEHLCETAVSKLRDYYLKNSINPYSCYPFGTYWIEDLNSFVE
jgi:hypothetical protein